LDGDGALQLLNDSKYAAFAGSIAGGAEGAELVEESQRFFRVQLDIRWSSWVFWRQLKI